MSFSSYFNSWKTFAQGSTPQGSSIKKANQTLKSNRLHIGNNKSGMTISPNGTLTVSGINTTASTTPWTTTAGNTVWNDWQSTYSTAPLIDAMRDLLVSLGFVENLVEHTYELDLKTKVRIPVGKIADLPQSQAQKIISQYLDEMKKKILEQVTDKILINRLIDTDKKDKNIKLC